MKHASNIENRINTIGYGKSGKIPVGALVMICAVLIIGAAGCGKSDKGGTPQGAETQAAEVYTCPMHPSVISDHPGACPVCGMALVKKSAQKELSGTEEAMLQTVTLSPTQRVLANVATAPVHPMNLAREIALAGVVDYAEPLQSTITSRFQGRVEKLFVNVTGEVVHKGDPLCEIYSPDLVTAQQEYLTVSRGGSGSEDGSTHAEIVRTARARLIAHFGMSEEQVAELGKSGRAKQVVTVYAHRGGTVLRKDIREGQYVNEGGVLFQLADLSRVWVYAEVAEADLRFVRRGMTVSLRADAWPGEAFTGAVTFIDPVVNAVTRTVRVRAEFANAGGRLKPGMFVTAVIGAALRNVLAVPATAVLRTGARTVAWVEVRPNQFEPRTVTTGMESEGMVAITGGLQEGETVVVSGGYLIDSESQLQNPAAGGASMPGMKMSAPGGDTRDMPMPPSEKPSGKKSAPPADKSMQNMPMPPAANGGDPAPAKDRVRTVTIVVDNAYAPEVVKVKRGEKVRLVFDRREDSKCSEEVVFKDFNIKRFLPAFKKTAVVFTPMKAGKFTFSCGMDMLHGTLVVEN